MQKWSLTGEGLCPEKKVSVQGDLTLGDPRPEGGEGWEDVVPSVNRMTHASENITFPYGRKLNGVAPKVGKCLKFTKH